MKFRIILKMKIQILLSIFLTDTFANGSGFTEHYFKNQWFGNNRYFWTN